MNIALYGGTFDPIHYGHLIIAEEIRQRFLFNQIYFIPCGIPPHKVQKHITSASDRYFMVTLATLSNPHFFSSSAEIDRGGPSYSIETIQFFRQQLGPETKLYFIMGVDAFLEISTWKNFYELLTSCRLVVTSRPGLDLQTAIQDLSKILLDYHKGLHFSFHKMNSSSRLTKIVDKGENVFFVEVTEIDISSTLIQLRASMAKSLRYLVPSAVEEYIKKYGLYAKGV